MGVMVTARFRFYAGLNAFIAPQQRGRSVTARCARMATSKHMIEAFGVPHTEVGLILINGESAGLDRLLRDGDRVTVYPPFMQIDINGFTRLAPLPAELKFVADVHLGGLARMLRMAGFDTFYRDHLDDEQIAALSVEETRIVLTRDRELLKRSGVAHGCYVHALKSELQLKEIADRLGLAEHAAPFTRCLRCNARLHDIAKEEVEDRLPPSVRATQAAFRHCRQCDGVFWQGSHWKRMCCLLAAIGITD
jgi:uncharacterized protein